MLSLLSAHSLIHTLSKRHAMQASGEQRQRKKKESKKRPLIVRTDRETDSRTIRKKQKTRRKKDKNKYERKTFKPVHQSHAGPFMPISIYPIRLKRHTHTAMQVWPSHVKNKRKIQGGKKGGYENKTPFKPPYIPVVCALDSDTHHRPCHYHHPQYQRHTNQTHSVRWHQTSSPQQQLALYAEQPCSSRHH